MGKLCWNFVKIISNIKGLHEINQMEKGYWITNEKTILDIFHAKYCYEMYNLVEQFGVVT